MARQAEHEPSGAHAPSDVTRSSERQRRRATLRRSLSLTFLSTLVPGLGLMWTKRRTVGVILLLIAVIAGIALSIFLLSGNVLTGAANVLTSTGLKLALVALAAALVLWLTSIVLTARTTHTDGWSHRGDILFKAFTALMCLAVTMPLARAVSTVTVTQDAFGTMFIKNGKGAASTKENAFKKKARVNLMLVGSDAGSDRTGIRTDSLMVASIDTHTGDTTLISIPRNWNYVPFPESNPLHKLYPNGFHCPERGAGDPCWMDAVWSEADTQHPELFPGEQYAGLNATRDVVQEIIGMPIDYSTVINLKGFQDLVDAMGGVDMTIPPGGIAIGGKIEGGAIVPGSITGRIPEGRQHLNGQQALWYSRSRVETGDGDRMRRQRCMVNALIDQTNPISLVNQFPSIMKVAKENILLDLPQSELPDLADLANTMKKGQTKSVNLAYPVISDSHPDYDKVRALIKKGMDRSTPAPKPKSSSSASSSTAPNSSSSSASTSSSSSDQAIDDTTATC
ncbi:LCP family protein [Dermacoccus nishinomiyaensis]|uniref:LCP family protein n=1 Tax=Dermacoccus nishinomiyaensis TaxID=1274 RepID=UPI000DFF0E32|nr:LCP family protein [Dermacoccus nishinomiyaensis]TCJ90721.1 LytR family transcriptional attenuator [Dermacoccus sp. SAI-028]STD17671.1 Membrane-bound protein lytR [Dermacoccus nishinomiyaensis]